LDACFVVRDHNGQALAYVYFEDEPGRRSAAKLLSKDEARKIASNIAKLPGVVGKKPQSAAPHYQFPNLAQVITAQQFQTKTLRSVAPSR
jgi:hypothetical protein